MSTPSRSRSDLGSDRLPDGFLSFLSRQENETASNSTENQLVIWGTDVHMNDCKRRFINFIRKFHLSIEEARIEGVDATKPFYLQKLEEIHLLERPFLNVNCSHLIQIDRQLNRQLVDYPQEVVPIFDIAINELFFSIYENDALPHQIQVRPFNVDRSKTLRFLEAEGFFSFSSPRNLFDKLFVCFSRHRSTRDDKRNDHSIVVDRSGNAVGLFLVFDLRFLRSSRNRSRPNHRADRLRLV